MFCYTISFEKIMQIKLHGSYKQDFCVNVARVEIGAHLSFRL